MLGEQQAGGGGTPATIFRGEGARPSLADSGRTLGGPVVPEPSTKADPQASRLRAALGRAFPTAMPTSIHPFPCPGVSTACGFSGSSERGGLPEEWLL